MFFTLSILAILSYPGAPFTRVHTFHLTKHHNSKHFSTPLQTISDSSDLISHLTSLDTKDGAPAITFVSGKGGVGKTSVSSALSLLLQKTYNNNDKSGTPKRVLVCSTDPAHSLFDALDIPSNSMGKIETVNDYGLLEAEGGGGVQLKAVQIEVEDTVAEFKRAVEGFSEENLAQSLGIPLSMVQSLGLSSFSSILSSVPPGLDEVLALSSIFSYCDSGNFDHIIVDTAPTGHTLRLLSLPEFLDSFLTRIINLKGKIENLLRFLPGSGSSSSSSSSSSSGEGGDSRKKTVDDSLRALSSFKEKMSKLKDALTDSSRSSFVVVTAPTKLASLESQRLITELKSRNIAVNYLIANQILSTDAEPATREAFLERRVLGQTKNIETLKSLIGTDRKMMKIEYSDTELVSIPALAYHAKQTFLADDDDFETKSSFYLFGGKGGVGKTTTSATFATSLALRGEKVAIISTDPAHSLQDALGVTDLSNRPGVLVDVSHNLFNNDSGGTLHAMEIDAEGAVDTFRDLITNMSPSSNTGAAASEIVSTIKEMSSVFDTLPPGADEIIALTKVIDIVRQGDFDKIVIDTAPTGHTLRMLNTPTFLDDLVEKVIDLSDKIQPAIALFGGNLGIDSSTVEKTKLKLQGFQLKMYELEELFSDESKSEFVIVTIPTSLAVTESGRLLTELASSGKMQVKNVVVNQIVREDNDKFYSVAAAAQKIVLDGLGGFCDEKGVSIKKVDYLNEEPRGAYGLKYLGDQL